MSKRRVSVHPQPSAKEAQYLSAVREFTQMTIQNPSFFEKTQEEQRELALATVTEHTKPRSRRARGNEKH